MKPFSSWTCAFVLGLVLIAPRFALAQAKPDGASASSRGADAPADSTPDYPERRAGVLIHGEDWAAIDAAMPAKMRAKGAIAQSLSYGAVRGTAVADYAGEHAAVQVKPGRAVICVCRITGLSGDPVIVKLHPQKGMRELDGGKLPVLGGKIADASKTDLVPTDVSRPADNIWLVQTHEALPEGEYALMLGTQNMAIFPFTVAAANK